MESYSDNPKIAKSIIRTAGDMGNSALIQGFDSSEFRELIEYNTTDVGVGMIQGIKKTAMANMPVKRLKEVQQANKATATCFIHAFNDDD